MITYTSSQYEESEINDYPSLMSPYKGCFSFLNDNKYVVHINTNLRAKIRKLDDDVARLYFTDDQDNQVPVPANITVMNLSSNQASASFGDSFFPTWISNYSICQDGVEIFRLERKKQHAVLTTNKSSDKLAHKPF
ncbi:hypothetical protein Glove_707g79 [Diversispora epigaea]|uniref:Uncharacterized protein n=1 Tax=Diversispora epigaea TaxID=1348612 RepID=A0A397G7J7_9GLOM|nr:hypothetical protein Glove_707g79 [Diversispora epigaea]